MTLPSSGDFHAFTIKFAGRVSRIVTDVQIAPAFDPAAVSGTFPDHHSTTALWDTGATNSVVSPSTASALSLVPAGKAYINHAGGQSQVNRYMVNILLPNQVGITGVLVSECHDQVDFGAIIGMDVIGFGDLAITHVNGLTCMSFRTPSISTVDYVAEAEDRRHANADVGRNDPCPCGKTARDGKPIKFKYCHGKRR